VDAAGPCSTQPALVDALETLRTDDARRRALGAAGFALMGTRNSPERVGLMYKEALERAAEKQRHGRRALLRALLSTRPAWSSTTPCWSAWRAASHAPDPLRRASCCWM
jgi:hypothetical protein